MKSLQFNTLVLWIIINLIVYGLLLIIYVTIGVLSKNRFLPHKKYLAYIDRLMDKI